MQALELHGMCFEVGCSIGSPRETLFRALTRCLQRKHCMEGKQPSSAVLGHSTVTEAL
jgi:hypothetical protein